MADIKKVFEKQGGKELLKRWWKAGVLPFAVMQTLSLGFSKKSLELLRLCVNNKILQKLHKKYRKEIAAFRDAYLPQERTRSQKVWVCWLQGMDAAPLLVQRCYRSLQENLTDREIILLTEKNYQDFVTFPAHVQEKIDSGIITKTHFSDLLRLELLLNHGGTWIDATVFCSGKNIPDYMLSSDLFLFQNLKPGADGHPVTLSSWFMTACTNHPVLAMTRHLLYRYWEKNNSLVDYFLLHDFLQLSLAAYPEEHKRIVPFSNATPHILLLRLFESYDEDVYRAICAQTPFHKLSYKSTSQQQQAPDTYYQHILR